METSKEFYGSISMHGLRAVRGSIYEFDWFWITHTEGYLIHTQRKKFMFLKVLKGSLFGLWIN